MDTKKIRLTKKLQERYGLDLAQEPTFKAEKELDYILVYHDTYDFFGYGDDVPSAMAMLTADIKMVQEDYESGLINERNTNRSDIRRLRALFGKEPKK